MTLTKLGVRAQLSLAFGTVIVLLATLAGLAWYSLASSYGMFSDYVRQDVRRMTMANQILDHVNARAIGARNLVLAASEQEREPIKAEVVRHHEALQQRLADLKTAIEGMTDEAPQERKLFDAIAASEAKYGPVALSIVADAMRGDQATAIDKLNQACLPQLAQILGDVNAYVSYSTQMGEGSVAAASTRYRQARLTLMLLAGAALTVAVALNLLIVRNLLRALGAEPRDLGDVARLVAEGDLAPIAQAGRAPAGSVLASLAMMQGSLAGIVAQVREAADAIVAGSGQIASGATDLSRRTEDQAGNLQQTAASMEQISATIRHNADTAAQANQLASSASETAVSGGEVMSEVVRTMEGISSASRKITDIIGVIDGIAFQTNILALNAAVEAARAGEQGRGFAVVAGEVRMLAQRSADAAHEIKALIGDSVAQVDGGTRLVGQAGQRMSDIVAQVRRVTDLMAEISSATQEQTTGAAQVSSAMHQLDQTTQQNSSLVEKSAAASASLQGQAARLTQLMQRFRLQAA
ncbi:MAG: methyl-accepting chemotaxis protein [Proteobacteria bacterium]|nr:methyl-accepting chemotaxis protein [Pseudomonadota bacterium]